MSTNYEKNPVLFSNEDQLLYKEIGNRIKELRIKAGYSAAEKFAYEFKFSRTQYARYESGTDMCISTLRKIAAAHNITLHEFFKDVVPAKKLTLIATPDVDYLYKQLKGLS